MTFLEFCEEVQNTVQTLLGTDYNVSLVKNDKLNGLKLVSLVILRKGEAVAPNIYLEKFYSEFQLHKQITIITDKIISLYTATDKSPILAACSFTEFQNINDRLYYKLVNYEKNKTFLSNVPHIKWMDLAVIFCILVKKDADGIGSITVKNDLMELWQVSADTLYETALKNTPPLFEFTVRPMDDIIRSIVTDQFPLSDDNTGFDEIMTGILQEQNANNRKSPMYVASNKTGINGAAWLLQKDELFMLSKKLDCNLFILPSSIHEVIIVPFSECISQYDLYKMVQEVNATQVAPEEFLSDNVYLYTREDDALLPLFSERTVSFNV